MPDPKLKNWRNQVDIDAEASQNKQRADAVNAARERIANGPPASNLSNPELAQRLSDIEIALGLRS